MIGMFFGYFNPFRHWFELVDLLEVNVPLVHPHCTVGADDGDQLGGDIFPVLWHKSDIWEIYFGRIDFNLLQDPYSTTIDLLLTQRHMLHYIQLKWLGLLQLGIMIVANVLR